MPCRIAPRPAGGRPLLLVLFSLLLLGSPCRTAAQPCLTTYALVGAATLQGSQYQLTQSGNTLAIGAMWSANTIDLSYDFDLRFVVNQCGAADGLVFALHQGGTRATSGIAGGELGYYGTGNHAFARSVAIELDTYNNGLPFFFDADSSHLALVVNGVTTPVLGLWPISPALGSCRDRELRVTWSAAAQQLAADLDSVRTFTYPRDLVTDIFGGNPHVTFGFIGATGGQSSTQTITPGVLRAGGPAPTILADGPTTICRPDSVTLRVDGQPPGTTYAWQPATGLGTTTTAAVVAAPPTTTTYTVTVNTPDGCSTQRALTVTVRPPLRAAAAPAQPVCAGQTARLSASSTGGGSAVSYQWSPAAGLNTPVGDTVLATPAATTLYTVTATNADGCVAHDTVRVVVRPPVSVTAGPDQVIRPGRRARLRVPNAVPGTTYAWSPAPGLSALSGPAVFAAPAVTTRYTVTATDSAGCTGQATVLVEVRTTLQVTASPDQEICPGGSATLTATSDDPHSTYAWSPPTGLNTTTGPRVVASPTVATTYSVVATDSGGYTGQASVRVRLAAVPVATPRVALVNPADGQMRLGVAVLAGEVTTYAWDFGDGSPPAFGAAPVHAYPQPGLYQAHLTITYGPGCTTALAVPVTVPAFALPNIITPNHDGYNDTFRPLVSAEPLTLRVYDRWGRLLVERADYAGDWDAEGHAAGTYYYQLTTPGGARWKGWLEVVR